MVFTHDGDATRWRDGNVRKRLWTVKWQKADLVYGEGGAIGGSMSEVTGEIYGDGKEASTFKAKSAEADRDTGELKLVGAVEVRSIQPGATLRCETLRWASNGQEIVRAQGQVRVESDGYRLGSFEQLWATPDLSQVGTPDAFTKT